MMLVWHKDSILDHKLIVSGMVGRRGHFVIVKSLKPGKSNYVIKLMDNNKQLCLLTQKPSLKEAKETCERLAEVVEKDEWV